MSDVGEPTPMKREQDREAEIRSRLEREYWGGNNEFLIPMVAVEDVRWLVAALDRERSELARLRTEAHQMQAEPNEEALEAAARAMADHTGVSGTYGFGEAYEQNWRMYQFLLPYGLAALRARSVLRATEAANDG